MADLSVQIATGANDGSGRDGSFSTSGASLDFGNINGNSWHGFARFALDIAQGATIQSAILQFKASGSYSGTTCNLQIGFEQADNPSAPTSYADMVGRSLGDLISWNNVGAWSTDTWYDSPDLTEELQAIVDRGGWASGQYVLAVVKNNSSSFQASRACRSYENAAANSIKLTVTYAATQTGEIADGSGLGDAVDGFSLTDTITDAAGLGDAVDAYNTDEVMGESIALGDTVAGEAEIGASLGGAAGLGDLTDAGFEAEGALTDAAGMGDTSDGFNWTAWLATNRDLAVIRYYCTLTGAADGLADVTLPVSSFQARKRTDQRDYLSVVVPGIAYADAIASRANGDIYIEMAYLLDGVESVREEIIRADLEKIDIHEGTRNRSITLSGYGDGSMPARAASIRGANYKATYSGSMSFRFPQADPYLNPGDALTVLDTSDSLTVDQITYAISARGSKFMEVREA